MNTHLAQEGYGWYASDKKSIQLNIFFISPETCVLWILIRSTWPMHFLKYSQDMKSNGTRDKQPKGILLLSMSPTLPAVVNKKNKEFQPCRLGFPNRNAGITLHSFNKRGYPHDIFLISLQKCMSQRHC